MKSKRSITVSLTLSLLAAQSLIAADPAKKGATKAPVPAAKAPAAAVKATTPPAANDPQIKDPVAVVEGQEIKKADLDEALVGVLAQSGRKPADIPPEQKAGAYRMILDDIIVDKLIAKRSADEKVTDEEVDATFKKMTEGHGSDEEIKKQIEQSGQTIEKIKANIRNNLKQQKWVEEQIKGKDDVAEADAKAFYDKNPEQFKAPERVRASHILLSLKADSTPEEVTKKEKAAQDIAARAKKGEDFAAMAKELSEDPSGKANGGDLDFFTKEQMVPEFASAAFGMKKGDISDPVRSQFGYHIIKLTDRKDPETVTLEKAMPQLMAYLKQQKKQEAVQNLVKEIREKADVKINLPEPAPIAPAPIVPGASSAPTEAVTPPVSAPAADAPAAPEKK